MTHLGTLKGKGWLHIGTERFGPFDYVIDVTRPRTITNASGTLDAPRDVMHRLQQAGSGTLEVTDGTVTVLAASWGSGPSRIEISGPVPGY